MQTFIEILKHLDWSPLFISLKTGIVVTIISFFIGIWIASRMMICNKRLKSVLDSILTLPMVLPPTVAGFILLLLFSLRRPFGSYLYGTFNIKVVQSWLGCIIAATFISLPLMYKNARASFEQFDVNLIYAGKTLGMTNIKIFWKIIIPNCRHGLISGAVLTFARAIGEYGATSMVAGNIAGKTGTVSQKIAMVIQDGDYITAGIWVIIVILISFIIILFMNLTGIKKSRNKSWQ